MKEFGKVLRLLLLCLGLALCILGRGMLSFTGNRAKDVMVMTVLSEETENEKEALPLVLFRALAPVNMPDSRQGLRTLLFSFFAALFLFLYRDTASFVCIFLYLHDKWFFRAPVMACFLGGRGPPAFSLLS
ncbi:MAG: hypothetical protein LBJ90_03790 [Treponema sp.]|jgi:hypothetical protein|nr:hypothetical protein [Treponema sp.]